MLAFRLRNMPHGAIQAAAMYLMCFVASRHRNFFNNLVRVSTEKLDTDLSESARVHVPSIVFLDAYILNNSGD